jgi:hypothetical protein
VSKAPEFISRCKFSLEEDNKLRSLVAGLGTRSWDRIGCFMPGRTARQCRDRYKNYLMDSLVNRPWTPEEDSILIDRFHLLGPKWVEIGKLLNGRSGNNVKNRWYKHITKAQAVQLGATNPANQIPHQSPPGSPALEERPDGELVQDIGTGDCRWDELLESIGKEDSFDSLWGDALSFGEPFP